jgi:hypothetical protein
MADIHERGAARKGSMSLTIDVLRSLLRSWWFLLGLAGTILVAASWCYLFRGVVAISPDSATYIRWSPLVPLGYPLFVSAVKLLTGSIVNVPVAQTVLLAGALLYIFSGIHALNRSAWVALVSLALAISYSPSYLYFGSILSEGLFVPLVLINVGAAMRLSAKFSRLHAVILACSAALAVFVRPAGLFVPAAALVLIAIKRSDLRRMVIWCGLPLIFGMIGIPVANGILRGADQQFQTWRVVFPTVASLLDKDAVDIPYADPVSQALRPHLAKLSEQADLQERFMFLMNDYNPRLLDTDKAIWALAQQDNRWAPDQGFYQRLNDVYRELTIATLIANPAGYAKLVAEQALGAWLFVVLDWRWPAWSGYSWLAAPEQLQGRLDIVKAYDLPLEHAQVDLDANRINAPLAQIVNALDYPYQFIRESNVWRVAVISIGIILLVAIPIALVAPSPLSAAAAYLGSIIHGSIFLVAFTTVFIPRYSAPTDPLVLIAAVLIVAWIVKVAVATLRIVASRLSNKGDAAGAS